MDDKIRQAVAERQVLEVEHQGIRRVVEPYLVYESKAGRRVLHAWQVGCGFTRTPPPDWANLALDDITAAAPTGQQFAAPHAGYKPDSPAFHRVLYHT